MDGLFRSITNIAQRNSVTLNYTPVPGSATGEVQATWDIVLGQTPVEPTYPGGGSLIVAGVGVAGPDGGADRFKLTVPAYAGYSYEIYGNPSLGALSWATLPFSTTQTGSIDRNIYTATGDGPLELFVEQRAVKGFYYVAFRVPGANTGTPSSGGV